MLQTYSPDPRDPFDSSRRGSLIRVFLFDLECLCASITSQAIASDKIKATKVLNPQTKNNPLDL